MTIEEKLTHFYDTLRGKKLCRQGGKRCPEHKEALDAALEEHKNVSWECCQRPAKPIANAKRSQGTFCAEQLHPAKLDCRQSYGENLCRCSGTASRKSHESPHMKNIFVQRSRKLSALRNTMRSRSIFQKKMNPVCSSL